MVQLSRRPDGVNAEPARDLAIADHLWAATDFPDESREDPGVDGLLNFLLADIHGRIKPHHEYIPLLFGINNC